MDDSLTCMFCDDVAMRECATCGQLLCGKKGCEERLNSAHEKVRVGTKHQLKLRDICSDCAPLDEAESAQRTNKKCAEHNRKLRMYCLDCNTAVCSDCLLHGLSRHFHRFHPRLN